MRRSFDGLEATFVVGLTRGDGLPEAVGWSLSVGGALVALLVGGSGSASVNYHGSRDVVGSGRFVGERVPLTRTPFVWALVGVVCAAIGIVLLVI